jgi:hypothetical protein
VIQNVPAIPTGTYVQYAGLSNGSDDTASLNALLAANLNVRGFPGQNYLISAPLVIRSGSTLDMAGCTVTEIAGSNCNMVQNRAVATAQRTVSDGAITNGSATLTIASAATADIGRRVVVAGAVASLSGGGGPLCAVVTGAVVGVSLTLSVAATATVSGAPVSVYDSDSDITVTGGTWARGANSGGSSSVALHTFRFRRCDGLRVRNLRVTSSNGKYAMSIGSATKIDVDLIDLAVASDGIHFEGDVSDFSVTRISGSTGDDAVALTARQAPLYATYEDVTGDISDGVIEDINVASSRALVKLQGGTSVKMRGIDIRKIAGTAAVWGIAVIDDGCGLTDIGGLVIDGLTLVPADTKAIADLSPGAGKDVTLRNVHVRRSDTIVGVQVKLANWAQVDIDGIKAPNTPTNVVLVATTGAVTDLTIANAYISATDTTGSMVCTFGAFAATRVKFVNPKMINGRSLFDVASGATIGQIQVANLSLKGTNRISNLAANVQITLTNIVVDSLVNPAFATSGGGGVNLRIRGYGVHRVTGWAGLTQSAAESVYCYNPDFPIDVAVLQRDSGGGNACLNTNAAATCGAGKVENDGTTTLWTNPSTGAMSGGVVSGAVGAAAGSSPSAVTATGTTGWGTLAVTSGTSTTTGTLITVTYPVAFGTAPKPPVVVPTNAAAVAAQPYVSSSSTTGFVISVATAPAASTVLGLAFAVST